MGERDVHSVEKDAAPWRFVGLTDEQSAEVRRLMAQAWDEGYRSGLSNAMRRMSDEPDAPTTPNPYRVLPPAEPNGGAS